MYYGKYWCDVTQARSFGLPPQSYGRESPMSDRMQALLCNPWFYVEDTVPCMRSSTDFVDCHSIVEVFDTLNFVDWLKNVEDV